MTDFQATIGLRAGGPASQAERVPRHPGCLKGGLVQLEPLSHDHVEGLVAAAAEERSSFGWAAVPSGPDEVSQYVANLLHAQTAGEAVPFAQVRVNDNRVVGATRFLNLRARPNSDLYAVEIGGTWLAASAQRTGTNTEAKLMLMRYAFEEWHVGRVDIKTDARNTKARHAIAALGAQLDGVLRQWQPSQAAGEDDLLRDSAMYSVTRSDWPEVRAGLEQRLASLG